MPLSRRLDPGCRADSRSPALRLARGVSLRSQQRPPTSARQPHARGRGADDAPHFHRTGTVPAYASVAPPRAGRVIALEMSEARKQEALEVGTSMVTDPKESDTLARVKALTGGYGADVSFECIGHTATAKLAIDVIRKAGKSVMVDIVSTEKDVIGSLAYSGEFADVIRFIADGRTTCSR